MTDVVALLRDAVGDAVSTEPAALEAMRGDKSASITEVTSAAQGFAIDTSLLCKITVRDSNVPATGISPSAFGMATKRSPARTGA